MKVITTRIAWINYIYSAYVVLKYFYVGSLLHKNDAHPACVIIYPVCNMTFLHYQHIIEPIHCQSRNLRNTWYLFLYWVCKLLRMWLTVNFRLVNSHM